MKRVLLFYGLLFISSLLFGQSDKICKIVEGEQLAASWKLQMQREAQTTSNTDDYDVKYYRLEFDVNPNINYIKGKVTVYFVPKTSGFSQITFDAASSLSIDSAKYFGVLNITFSAAQNKQRTFYFPMGLNANQLDSITIWYKGIPASTGFGSFVKSTHGTSPIIWTLSEPYGSRDWWVCKSALNDKADSVDIFIKTPSQYRAASNGLLTETITQGNDKIYHWKHRYPIQTYLIALAVTDYAVYSDHLNNANGHLEVLNYVYPEDSAWAAPITANLLAVIPIFESKFGPYPFRNEKYGHAQFGWTGGMEHQTMSFIGYWDLSLLSHELAHQWFGDAVSCGTWKEIFLNEGFATYAEGLVEEAFSTPANWLDWKSTLITNIISQTDGSVYCPDTTSLQRIFDQRLTYLKGAMFLHQMRWQLGDSLFFLGIRNYLTDPANSHKHGSVASLKAHWETVSGQNLTEFFADWFYGEGYPIYNISWSKAANGKVYIKLNQTSSYPSVSFFEMPVPIWLSDGTQQQVVVLNHTHSGQIFEVMPNFMVTQLDFDLDRWLIARANITVDNTLSVDNNTTFSVSMKPNPAQDFITIESGNIEMQKGKIIDLQGRTVKEFEMNGAKTVLSLSGIAEGTYLIELISEDKISQNKLVIKRLN